MRPSEFRTVLLVAFVAVIFLLFLILWVCLFCPSFLLLYVLLFRVFCVLGGLVAFLRVVGAAERGFIYYISDRPNLIQPTLVGHIGEHMKNKRLLGLLACLMAAQLVLTVIPASANNNAAMTENESRQDVPRGTVVYQTIESAHNYANNFDYTWTINEPGATEMRVHFTRIITERNYDYLYVYDQNWNTIYKLHGSYYSGGTTKWISGDTVYVRLVTDYSVTKWGFKIDWYEYEGGSVPDTTPPSVALTNPSNGDTVSGTVSVTATASDNVGVSKVEFYIDNVLKSTDTSSPYAYSWDTTGYSNGNHDVKAIAYDAADNTDQDQISVNVDNAVPSNELTSGVTVYSSLASVGDTEMWTIEVAADATSMHSVLNCGSSDFDLYGRLGAEPTTSTYDWRGYTSGGEDVTTSNPGAGTWYIMVRDYSGSGSYDLTVTLEYGSSSEWGTGGKYAILVGISDYGYISDLSYCDEDATDWYYQLDGLGYECHIYGDGHTANYPRYDGRADEAVVRNAVQGLAEHAQNGDQVVFITSGHGSGDGHGSSYLCMWDCSGSAGCYYDTELAADIGGFVNGVDIFVFVDHCYSGGMGPELMALSNSYYIYCATTCTEDGYGWDDSTHHNGMWTYYFLDYSWQTHYSNNAGQSMESVFTYAHDNYPKSGGDEPQEFDGNTGGVFTLN